MLLEKLVDKFQLEGAVKGKSKMDNKLSVAGGCSKPQNCIAGDCDSIDTLPQECRFGWYWNRKVIENYSPSRKDGIDLRNESQLRMLYCSFIRDIGMKLRVPQITIATAMMFCHRFYLHQSHAKNEWQTIAAVCIFLASKAEDTPCQLNKVVTIAYETMYQNDYVAAQRINNKEVFEKQKSLILLGERLVLCTIRFDFNVQHPYKPLCEAFRKLQIAQKNVRQTAWNYVNDCIQTTLCLQYKPNYIAAGSLYLAAQHDNVKLPSGENGCGWWQVLNVVPYQLNAVVQQMRELFGCKKRPMGPPPPEKPKQIKSPVVAVAREESLSSPDSCILSGDGSSIPKPTNYNNHMNTEDQCETRNSESPNGAVENHKEVNESSDQNVPKTVNVDRIKSLIKMRKRNREGNERSQFLDLSSEDDWIERELERGIELSAKKQKPCEIL